MKAGLNRRARPARFADIAGQESASMLLLRIARDRKSAVPYLFSGPRGSGKTSAARIIAKSLNCASPRDGEPCCECASCLAADAGTHLDIVEIDAASNRGIDNVRDLREAVALAPMMGQVKVYILDEVHMLSNEAFNALLKTLEEPPPTAAFIFATTDPQKVPVTIRSRCVHVRFRRIAVDVIAARLRELCTSEGQEADDDALAEIAHGADGAMRDAVTLLEQASSIADGERITFDVARTLMGGCDSRTMADILSYFVSDPSRARAELRSAVNGGAPPERLLEELYTVARDAWAASMWKDSAGSPVPNAPADGLRRAARAVASLIPRARAGLRADVFAELLFEGMYDAFYPMQTQTAPQSAPQRGVAAVRAETRTETRAETRAEARAEPEVKSRFTDRPMPVRRAQEPAQVESAAHAEGPTQTADRETCISDPTSEVFASLPINVLCALVGARASIEGGELVIDTSRSRPLARSILSLPRSKRQIVLALRRASKGEESDAGEEAIEKAQPRDEAQIQERPQTQDKKTQTHPQDEQTPERSSDERAIPLLTIGHLSAKLGAEVLLTRSLAHDDDSSSLDHGDGAEEEA